jgi:hypothetical protein
MAPSPDNLLSKTDGKGKTLVDNKKANSESVSTTSKRRLGMNWTEILKRNNLESPGYKETIDQMKKEGRIKGY